jgi:hypothetical protein
VIGGNMLILPPVCHQTTTTNVPALHMSGVLIVESEFIDECSFVHLLIIHILYPIVSFVYKFSELLDEHNPIKEVKNKGSS